MAWGSLPKLIILGIILYFTYGIFKTFNNSGGLGFWIASFFLIFSVLVFLLRNHGLSFENSLLIGLVFAFLGLGIMTLISTKAFDVKEFFDKKGGNEETEGIKLGLSNRTLLAYQESQLACKNHGWVYNCYPSLKKEKHLMPSQSSVMDCECTDGVIKKNIRHMEGQLKYGSNISAIWKNIQK